MNNLALLMAYNIILSLIPAFPSPTTVLLPSPLMLVSPHFPSQQLRPSSSDA